MKMTRRKEMMKKESKQRIVNIFDRHSKNDEKSQLE